MQFKIHDIDLNDKYILCLSKIYIMKYQSHGYLTDI